MAGDRTPKDRKPVDRYDRLSSISGAFANAFMPRLDGSDPDDLNFPWAVSVWGHWLVGLSCMAMLVYRPQATFSETIGYSLCLIVLFSVNGISHYRLVTGKSVSWIWMLGYGAIDVALVTAAMVIWGSHDHYFFYLLYYPGLVWFAVVFSSFRLNMAWTTLVAAIYLTIGLTMGDELDFDAFDDKVLFARIVVMYMVSGIANLISANERKRRLMALDRERELERERIELSRSMHDRTAQSVYMIGIAIETAIETAGTSNRELHEKLEAARQLSKSAIWELRHPVDIGLIFEGRGLHRVLNVLVATFTTITSIPAEVVQTGTEPDLPTAVRGMLFSIAHNALTNSFRHALASKVIVELDFLANKVRLSVSDDGVGLPVGYEERGHGFRNMRAYAERSGGRLETGPNPSGQGTTVTCVIEN